MVNMKMGGPLPPQSTWSNSTATCRLAIAIAIVCGLFIHTYYNNNVRASNISKLERSHLPTLKTRDDLGSLLESLGFHTGVELGVQRGIFTKSMLDQWKSATEYVLVDLWSHQANYEDVANVDEQQQSDIMADAMNRLKEFSDKIQVCKNYTTVCSERFSDGYFDFIYVDARHDYVGAREDMVTWWPKLKRGGIMAGHDYLDAQEVADLSGQNWSISADGTVNTENKAVKSAVDEFATEVRVPIQITYRDAPWNTWVLLKK
jgi:predicted O-methyltransferase YrrM